MTKRVEVHIDRLVLHGVAPGDRSAVAQAVEREVARLAEAGGLAGGTVPRLAPIRLPGRGEPSA